MAASMHAAPAEGWAAGGAGLRKVEAAFAALDMDKYDAESDDDNLMGRLLQARTPPFCPLAVHSLLVVCVSRRDELIAD